MKRTFTISLTAIVILSLIVILAIKHTHFRGTEAENNDLTEMHSKEIAAENYMTCHNYVEAIRLFNEMEKEHGHNDQLCIERAEAYGALGLYELAVKDVESGMGKEPDWTNYTQIGDFYRLAGEYEKAIEAFSNAIEISPDEAFPYYRRGWCYELMGNKDMAMNDYNKAIEVDVDYTYTYLMRGELLLAQGKYNEAKADFEKVLDQDFICMDGSCRHYALHFTGKDKEAEEWMNQLIELQPDNCGYYYDQACLYARMDKISESISALRTAFEKGYCSFAQIEHDDDLDPIRDKPEFKDLFDKSKEKHYSFLRDNGLYEGLFTNDHPMVTMEN